MLLSIFGKRGAHRSSGKCKGGVPMFQGQIGEFFLLSPGKEVPAIFFQNCRKFLQFETPITRQRKLQKPRSPGKENCRNPEPPVTENVQIPWVCPGGWPGLELIDTLHPLLQNKRWKWCRATPSPLIIFE